MPYSCTCDTCREYRDARATNRTMESVEQDSCDVCLGIFPTSGLTLTYQRGWLANRLLCAACRRANEDEDEYASDEDGEDAEEYSEYASDEGERVIRSYTFKPEPLFLPAAPPAGSVGTSAAVFLGFELEVEMGDYGYDRYVAARNAADILGDVAYFKADGSLNDGFETVTHPMTYQYAMESFPWKVLKQLRDNGCQATSAAGLHVHVSRDGFSGPAHEYRWMKLLYRNKDQIQKIARRQSGQWASFDTATGPFNYDTDSYSSDRKDQIKYVKKQAVGPRYVAINTRNEDTYEVRIFASSLNPQEVQAALGLVDATVEYTRQLSASDVLHARGWAWPTFAAWVAQRPQYAPLRKEMERLCVC